MITDDEKMPSEFLPRRWMLWASAIANCVMFCFAMLMGPLFATGLMKNARDEEVREAGFIMIALGLLVILPTLLVVAGSLVLGRGFLLKICREGLVYRTVGRMGLDRVPLVPGLVRAWARCVTGAAFRCEEHRIPWAELAGIEVRGFRGAQNLRIHQRIGGSAGNVTFVSFRDADFQAPLGRIVEAISFYSEPDERRAEALPGWDEPACPWR